MQLLATMEYALFIDCTLASPILLLASTLVHQVQKNGIVHSVHKSWCFTFTEYLYSMSCTKELLQF